MKKNVLLKTVSFALAMGFFAPMFVACSSSDDDNTDEPIVNQDEEDEDSSAQESKTTFLLVVGDATADLSGSNYLYTTDDVTTANETTVYGREDVLSSEDVFTQIANNTANNMLTGYVYGRGSSDGAAAMVCYEFNDGVLQQVGDRLSLSGTFGNTGVLGNYTYAAGLSSGIIDIASKNGSTVTNTAKTFDLTEYEIEGTAPSVVAIADLGNNTCALSFNYANIDEAVVAIADYDMNISNVIHDARIGASGGMWRSVRYSQVAQNDNGDVYVFSGTGEISGALRINSGETSFDADYMFDILAASGGHRFRKVMHITEDYFLLDFYADENAYGNMDTSFKFGVVNMSTKSFQWVSGLPEATAISSNGWATSNNGQIYLPINPSEGQPTIYVIDPSTAVATAGLTLSENELIKAITCFVE